MRPPYDQIAAELESIRAGGDVSDANIQRAKQACDSHPNRPDLWCLLGDLIRRAVSPMPFEHAMDAYRSALRIDPECAEAWQELGFCNDVYLDDPEEAERCFLNSIRFGGGPGCYVGLARVRAETGRRVQAIAVAEEGLVVFPNEPALKRIISEINAGEWDPIV